MKYGMWAMALPIFGALMGCGQTQTTAVEHEHTHVDSLPEVARYVSPLPDDAPVVKVVADFSNIPHVYKDEYGNPMGLDVDVIRAVGEESGFKVDFFEEQWSNLFASVQSGTRDLAISHISYTPERDMIYGLSDPYVMSRATIAYKGFEFSNPDLASFNELKGKKLAALAGSKQQDSIEKMGGYASFDPVSTVYLGFAKMVRGEVEALVDEETTVRYLVAQHPDQNIKVAPYQSADDPTAYFVMMMAKNNTELLGRVNAGLKAIKDNGRLAEIEQKWLAE